MSISNVPVTILRIKFLTNKININRMIVAGINCKAFHFNPNSAENSSIKRNTRVYAYFSSSRRLSSSSRSLFTRSSRSCSSRISFSRSRRRFRIDLSLRCFVQSKSTCRHFHRYTEY